MKRTSNTLMIVEDDLEILKFYTKISKEIFDNVVSMGSYNEAKDYISSRNQISACLIDYYLPGGNGLKLVEEMKKTNDKISTCLVTGRSDKDMLIKAVNIG